MYETKSFEAFDYQADAEPDVIAPSLNLSPLEVSVRALRNLARHNIPIAEELLARATGPDLPIPTKEADVIPIEPLIKKRSVEDYSDDTEATIIYFIDYQKVEAARKNQQGFENLLSEYEALLKGLSSLYFIQGGREEDVLQEARIGFFKAVRDYNGADSSFGSFLHLVVNRHLITAIKQATRQKHGPLNNYLSFEAELENQNGFEGLKMGDAIAHPAPGVEATVESTESIGDLLKLLSNGLSRLESDVLRLFLSGLSYSSIGDELGVSYKAIDNSLQRVKRKIHRYWENLEVSASY